jgi:AmpD protein
MELERRTAARERRDGRQSLMATAVEREHRAADLESQDMAQIMRVPVGDADRITRQRRIYEYPCWRRTGSFHGAVRLHAYRWYIVCARSLQQQSMALSVTVDPHTGWLNDVRRVVSPNCDARPIGCEPVLIVVHGISLPPGRYGGPWIDQLFTNTLDVDAHEYFATIGHLRVSAHALIRRDGELVQYVPFVARAWHAGESSYCGRDGCNDFSIGIELEGTDDQPYEAEQYRALAALVATLRRTYPSLREADLVGHADIAPDRKTDPGPAFDWARLDGELAKHEQHT